MMSFTSAHDLPWKRGLPRSLSLQAQPSSALRHCLDLAIHEFPHALPTRQMRQHGLQILRRPHFSSEAMPDGQLKAPPRKLLLHSQPPALPAGQRSVGAGGQRWKVRAVRQAPRLMYCWQRRNVGWAALALAPPSQHSMRENCAILRFAVDSSCLPASGYGLE